MITICLFDRSGAGVARGASVALLAACLFLPRPVFREFYAERDVVFEERRMRTESTPLGKFEETFEAMLWTATRISVSEVSSAARKAFCFLTRKRANTPLYTPGAPAYSRRHAFGIGSVRVR